MQETADGEVIVAHDSDFMKLAGVELKTWDATMSDLAPQGSLFDSKRAVLMSGFCRLKHGLCE